jgi:glucans biosynthesis protein C
MVPMPSDTSPAILPAPPARAVPSPRHHSLDALRAAMMLLGIWLHAVVAYSRNGGWPWKDGTSTPIFDWTLGLIHAFRMPTFYVMAGFFAALLLGRRGVSGFVRNRAVRILLPFSAGWVILYPVVVSFAIWGRNLDAPDVPRRIAAFFSSGDFARYANPMHLWFLEYLLLFYAIALAALPLARLAPRAVAVLDRAFRRAAVSPWRPLIFGAVTFPVLCSMENGWLDDPRGFVPEARLLLVYLPFFGAGWLLHRSADLLPRIGVGRRWAVDLAGALVTWSLAFACHFGLRDGADKVTAAGFLGCAGFHALAIWQFSFGFTGLFVRFLERPVPWLRWISDSSYWLYLAHMPVFLAVQIPLARSGLPATARIPVLLAISVPALLLSYAFLVRPTWVGAILNGRRYSPWSPPLPSGGDRGGDRAVQGPTT